MENKKIGGMLILLALVCGGLLWVLASQLQTEQHIAQCVPSPECEKLENTMSLLHIVIGVISFLLALGVYIMFFHKGEQKILQRLEEEKDRKLADEKLTIMLKMLDGSEQAVLKAIAEQDGIEQNTLKLRTGLSRSKVSEIVQKFEQRNLVERVKKGKTFTISIKEKL